MGALCHSDPRLTVRVRLPCPHNGTAIYDWLETNGMDYGYRVSEIFNGTPLMLEYGFINEADALMFRLRWL